jgi:hypothetical protein
LDAKEDENQDKLVRLLECATIEYIHKSVTTSYFADIDARNHTAWKIFDSVRGAFSEGGPAFPGAKIEMKSHIQICIRNLNCIKGFFHSSGGNELSDSTMISAFFAQLF